MARRLGSLIGVRFASQRGASRNGTIVSWPQGIAARAEIRTQVTHVIDVAPTSLEAPGPLPIGAGRSDILPLDDRLFERMSREPRVAVLTSPGRRSCRSAAWAGSPGTAP